MRRESGTPSASALADRTAASRRGADWEHRSQLDPPSARNEDPLWSSRNLADLPYSPESVPGWKPPDQRTIATDVSRCFDYSWFYPITFIPSARPLVSFIRAGGKDVESSKD